MTEKPVFIPLGLDKWQICSSKGCGNDADREFQTGNDRVKYFLAACPMHDRTVAELAENIQTAKDLQVACRRGFLDIEEVFVQPYKHTEKCKLKSWQQWLSSQPGATASSKSAALPAVTEKLLHRILAAADWTWPTNRNRWRTVDGEVVPLSRLRLAELVCAAQQISRVLFSRKAKSVRWIRHLVEQQVQYRYPVEALKVDKILAMEKLADFQEEAEIRGLLPPDKPLP